jgi:antitoxin (DNA-binding transcriptional repressor) of toxin-antitoxin stability system
MKSVGIRVLKNQLSKYIALVRQGETVLVTDRDQVVAEIRRPSPWHLPGGDPEWAALSRLEEEGKLVLAQERRRPAAAPPSRPPFRVDFLKVLDDVRGER